MVTMCMSLLGIAVHLGRAMLYLISANCANSRQKNFLRLRSKKIIHQDIEQSPLAKTPVLLLFFQSEIPYSLRKLSFIMAGLKRAVDGSEERNGKRSKTKEGSASKSKSVKSSSSSKKDSKKDSKSSKSDKKPSKKVQKEESEDDDDFDIDDVSDEDIDALDALSDDEMPDVSEEEEKPKSDKKSDSDDEEQREAPKNPNPNPNSKFQFCLLRGAASNRYCAFRQQLSRIPHQAKSTPAGAQGREAQCRYRRPLQEVVGAIAPQVPRASGAEKEACQGAV